MFGFFAFLPGMIIFFYCPPNANISNLLRVVFFFFFFCCCSLSCHHNSKVLFFFFLQYILDFFFFFPQYLFGPFCVVKAANRLPVPKSVIYMCWERWTIYLFIFLKKDLGRREDATPATSLSREPCTHDQEAKAESHGCLRNLCLWALFSQAFRSPVMPFL